MIDFVSISSTKLQDLFDKGGSDCVAMWMKYAYHCKRQKTNQVKATQSFMEKGLGWGRDKTRQTKQKLEELGFIEQFTRKDKAGKVASWYVKVNHLPRQTTLLKTNLVDHPTDFATGGETSIQILKGNKDKYINGDNWEASLPQEEDLLNSNITGRVQPYVKKKTRPAQNVQADPVSEVSSVATKAKKLQVAFTAPLSYGEVEQIAEVMTRYPIDRIDTGDQRLRTIAWAEKNSLSFNSRQHFINALKKGLENWYLKKIERGNNMISVSFEDGWASEKEFSQWNRRSK